MSDKLVLCRVNDEGAVFHILSDAQETQVANTSLNNYLVIVLVWGFSGDGENQYYSLRYMPDSRFIQLTPLGRTAIIDGEMDTFTDVQQSGAASPLIFSIASLIVFIPTACCTSEQPRY